MCHTHPWHLVRAGHECLLLFECEQTRDGIAAGVPHPLVPACARRNAGESRHCLSKRGVTKRGAREDARAGRDLLSSCALKTKGKLHLCFPLQKANKNCPHARQIRLTHLQHFPDQTTSITSKALWLHVTLNSLIVSISRFSYQMPGKPPSKKNIFQKPSFKNLFFNISVTKVPQRSYPFFG